MMKNLSITLTPKEKSTGWIYYCIQLLLLGTIVGCCNLILGNPLTQAQLNVLAFALNFALVCWIFRKFLWKNLKAFLQKLPANLAYVLCGLMLYYASTFAVGVVIVTLMPDFSNANDAQIGQLLQENYFLMSLATVVFVPITEETLYRGLIFGSVYRYNKLLGYLTSMLAFSLIHIVNYIGIYDPTMLMLSILQYLPAGFFLAWVYVKTDSVIGCTLMHMLINHLGTILMR